MADVLSQSEIDALLQAISSGEINTDEIKQEGKKIKSYDFKRALRYSKDQIRNLTRIHESYARLLTTYISAQLRTMAQVQVISADQLLYEEFIRSVPEMTILNIFEGTAHKGRMVMEVNPQIAFTMIDRLLGGTGIPPARKTSLTEIEVTLLEKLFSHAIELLDDAWKDVVSFEPVLIEVETNPQFMQIASSNETVVVISFSIKIGEATGLMNLCLPHIVLEPVIHRLTTHQWLSNQKTSVGKESEALKDRVQYVTVPVVTELGTAMISIEEFLGLSVGDVIALDQPADSLLNIKIGPKVKFLGRPGVKKGRMAVLINKVLEEGVDEDE